jgi:acetoin utilization protein AcuC
LGRDPLIATPSATAMGATSPVRPRPAVFVTHPVFRRPAFGNSHPLSIMRHGAVLDLCSAMGWLHPDLMRQAPLAPRSTLERFHTADYLDALELSARTMLATPAVRARWNLGTLECPLFAGLWDRARASVGGSLLAAELALQGYLAFHPGGGTHHGRPDRASGFCYLNDPVFTILRLLDAGLERVLYLDLDAHHGDGVEAAFVADERVTLVSIHEEGRWPGTGAIVTHGDGRVLNLPVPRHINDDEYMFVVRELCHRQLERFRPEAVVITCGADVLKGDPLTSMDVSNAALWVAVETSISLSERAVVLGGGGYNPWTTARLWAGLWARMSGREIPAQLPTSARRVLARLASDLVEEDDRDPAWFASIADLPNRGPIRAQIHDVIDKALPPTTNGLP